MSAFMDRPCPIRRIGDGQRNHFFGFYNKTTWDDLGRYLLANQVPMMTHDLDGSEVAEVGYFDLEERDHFKVVGSTTAWNWLRRSSPSCALANWGKASATNAATITTILFTACTSGRHMAMPRTALSGERDASEFALTHLVYMSRTDFDLESLVVDPFTINLRGTLLDHAPCLCRTADKARLFKQR